MSNTSKRSKRLDQLMPLPRLKSLVVPMSKISEKSSSKNSSKSSSKYLSSPWDKVVKTDFYAPFDSLRPEDILNDARIKAHRAAYKLIKELSTSADWNKGYVHQVATAESLTAGLIFSTIVDVPFGGAHKYGCLGVYDTDAKRIFLGVKVENLYTHRCAREMAEGILKNSNASIAISVSGNAMPNQGVDKFDEIAKLGEVFIGVAGYKNDGTILCETFVYNFCVEHSNALNLCKLWHDTIIQKSQISKIPEAKARVPQLASGFNDFITTSFVSNYIRNKTAEIALLKALKFIKKNKLAVPSFLQSDRPRHESDENPCNNKLLERTRTSLKTECINANCFDTSRDNSKFKNSALLPFKVSGGKKKSKKSK